MIGGRVVRPDRARRSWNRMLGCACAWGGGWMSALLGGGRRVVGVEGWWMRRRIFRAWDAVLVHLLASEGWHGKLTCRALLVRCLGGIFHGCWGRCSLPRCCLRLLGGGSWDLASAVSIRVRSRFELRSGVLARTCRLR